MSHAEHTTYLDVKSREASRKKTKDQHVFKFCLMLPEWFVHCIWEFEVHKSNGAWTAQFAPVCLRPWHTYAIDFVRSGNMNMVRNCLDLGHLSLRDQICIGPSVQPVNLLELSSENRCFDICDRTNLCRLPPSMDIWNFVNSCFTKRQSFMKSLS